MSSLWASLDEHSRYNFLQEMADRFRPYGQVRGLDIINYRSPVEPHVKGPAGEVYNIFGYYTAPKLVVGLTKSPVYTFVQADYYNMAAPATGTSQSNGQGQGIRYGETYGPPMPPMSGLGMWFLAAAAGVFVLAISS